MRLTPVFLSCVALLVAGCSNTVSKVGLIYNDGLAESFNSLILANVVRSAKGYPTYYSAIGDFTGTKTRTFGFTPSLSADFSESPPDVTASAGADLGVEDEANVAVSSLETRDFATSMHSSITPAIFASLTESRDRRHLPLTLVLLVELVVISEADFNYVRDSISTNCVERFELLSAAYKGICRFITSEHSGLGCYDRSVVRPKGKRPVAVITLLNDPTNACRYTLFRLFAEALTLDEPHVVQADSATVVTLGHVSPGKRLFQEPGTGMSVRAPHEVIAYLGQIVELTLAGGGGYLRLSSPEGESVPIFHVDMGKAAEAPIFARIDGVIYSVPGPGTGRGYFTFRAMAIVKDIIALNTSQVQLPRDRTVFIGGSSLR